MRIASRILTTTTALGMALTPMAFADSHGSDAASADKKPAESAQTDSTSGADTKQDQDIAATSDGEPREQGQDGGSFDREALVAKVGEEEITQGDVMAMINAMPQSMRQQQPSEALIPMAVEQLVMSELLLAAAKEEGLAEDEEVQAAVEKDQRMREEDAMVRIYLERELDGAVTDEKIQSTYDEIKSNADTEIPPLEAVRPQIEKQLRQEAYADLRGELQNETRIVFYGADGKPRSAGTSEQDAETGETSTN